MKVPLIDLFSENDVLRPEIDAAVARVLDSGRFILGAEVAAFEAEFAAAVGAQHAVGVSSGTDALLVALMALGVSPGDEVITTPFTFFATAGVVSRLGAKPVFVDIEGATFNLDRTAAAAAVTDRTKAIIAVSLFGYPCEFPDVGFVPIVEDAAQSLGTGAPRSICSTYSFFPAKIVGAFGDAGAVATDDVDFAARVRVLRAHGSKPKYFHALVGGNFRIDALQAAMLRVKLPKLPDTLAGRRRVAAAYRERLPETVTMQAHHRDHVYNYLVVRAGHRDELRAALRQAGIGTAIYYPLPLHLQECFADLGHAKGSLPIAEKAAEQVVALPCFSSMTDEQIDYVVDAIARFYSATD